MTSKTNTPSAARRPILLGALTLALGLTLAGASQAQTTAPDEAAAMKARFERLDTNHDGKLSKAEAAALPALATRFDELDTDHDGAVSMSEFAKGASAPQ